MNTFKLIILLLLNLNVQIRCQNNDSVIFWQEDTKLEWFYFKGKVPDSTNYQVAWSSVQIYTHGFWEQGFPNYEIYTAFKKFSSWSKDTSAPILMHEQLHFDIGELFARKMRKAIFELREKETASINDYLQILNTYFNECSKVNRIYDNETAHGIYKKNQEEWNAKIAKELMELKEYAVEYEEYPR